MLYGNGVTLRAWTDADLPLLSNIRNDVGLQLMLMAEPRPNPDERVRQWLQEKSAQPDSVFFVIAKADDNGAAGFIQAQRWERRNRSAYLGICLATPFQGRGFAREALQLMETYLRDTLSLRKLLLEVLTTNADALDLYKRAQYQVAGVLKAHHLVNGAYQDVVLMEKRLDIAQV
jgi:RimJ/RimL family protein N-acetyltransferase